MEVECIVPAPGRRLRGLPRLVEPVQVQEGARQLHVLAVPAGLEPHRLARRRERLAEAPRLRIDEREPEMGHRRSRMAVAQLLQRRRRRGELPRDALVVARLDLEPLGHAGPLAQLVGLRHARGGLARVAHPGGHGPQPGVRQGERGIRRDGPPVVGRGGLVATAPPLEVPKAGGAQGLQRASRRARDRHVVALHRRERLPEPPAQRWHHPAKGVEHPVLPGHLRLLACQHVARLARDPLEAEHVPVGHAADGAGDHRARALPAAHLHRQGPRQRRVGLAPHQPQRVPHLLLGHDAQEGRLLQLYGEGELQRAVEDRLARLVLEAEHHAVGLGQRGGSQ